MKNYPACIELKKEFVYLQVTTLSLMKGPQQTVQEEASGSEEEEEEAGSDEEEEEGKTNDATGDFQQNGILTSVDSIKPLQPPFKLRNSKCCLVSSLTVIEYSSD